MEIISKQFVYLVSIMKLSLALTAMRLLNSNNSLPRSSLFFISAIISEVQYFLSVGSGKYNAVGA